MEKCNFCQTPGKVRPLDMPRACEEICPTGAIRSGPVSQLSTLGRERAAARAGGTLSADLPAMILGAERAFGAGAPGTGMAD
jgi:anaerobic dimethyl sulfoxide reductase subunit B (iron-sulfur subunit)